MEDSIQSDTERSASSERSTVQYGVWQSIESAPKDGTPFLAYWMRYYSDGTRYEAAVPYSVVSYTERTRDVILAFPSWVDGDPPTHWMPLPSPPSNDDRDVEAERAGVSVNQIEKDE